MGYIETESEEMARRYRMATPKRELEVVPIACRWYGKNGMFGRLVPTGGNQCGLITDGHSPCKMELNGYPVDETRCPLVRQAIEAAGVPTHDS